MDNDNASNTHGPEVTSSQVAGYVENGVNLPPVGEMPPIGYAEVPPISYAEMPPINYADIPPISYAEIPQIGFVVGSSTDDIPPPKVDFSAPPPYEVATALPTYEEVQQEKRLEAQNLNIPPPVRPAEYRPGGQRILTIDGEDADDSDTSLLGTDFMFYTAFFVAFIFNWIGFLLLMCFCHTIASRYGALSGFGLSLAKWTLIVKHSTDLASRDNSWLWWLIMTFGLIICIRAILQYLSIKRGWRMLTASHQERLLFFY